MAAGSPARVRPCAVAWLLAVARVLAPVLAVVLAPVLAVGCDDGSRDGPADAGPDYGTHAVGSADAGQRVFRTGTFGNEGFWTDALGLVEGLEGNRLTPRKALALGLSINADALDAATRKALVAELADGGTPGPLLDDFATTVALLNANAFIGLVAVDREDDGDSVVDVTRGDRVGLSCALCHAVTDGSLLRVPGGGTIGTELDGPPNPQLRVGALFALGRRSRALLPLLQVRFGAALGGASIGPRVGCTGVTATSTEAEVDDALNDPACFPAGQADLLPDGIGAPTVIPPLVQTRTAAPWGHDGLVTDLHAFDTLVVTAALDPTTLATDAGAAFLGQLAGAAGAELAGGYRKLLEDLAAESPKDAFTGPPAGGYPFLRARPDAASLTGWQVDPAALRDLAAYTDSLRPRAPPPDGVDPTRAAFGRELFRSGRLGCTDCHRVDATLPVPSLLVPLSALWPDYAPTVLAERPQGPVLDGAGPTPVRPAALAPIQDAPGSYDDRLVIFEASLRGASRGLALPLLVELAARPAFLHDGSVPSLEALLDPARGPRAPHPFYVADVEERGAVVHFLRSLGGPAPLAPIP